MKPPAWLDDLRRDFAFAIRMVGRAPGFAAVVIITLGLGIGATTAIFSVVDHVLVRSLPLPHADRLVRLYESNPTQGRPRTDVAPVHVSELRSASKSFDLIATIGGTSLTITDAAEPEVLVGMLVGPEFFTLTGVRLAMGRPFDDDAYRSVANARLGPIAVRETATGDAVVIISHALWRRQFGSDPNVVGRSFALNGNRARVAGVMPADFRFDESAWGIADCWVPLVESRLVTLRRFRQYVAIGRLAPGATLPSAQAEVTAIAAAIVRDHPDDGAGWDVRLEFLKDSLVAASRTTLLILLGGVACVLLIAGANVANLLIMRAGGRARELAVRMAIGAGRSRLVRQWVTESIVLACLGGLAGLALAAWAVPALVADSPINLPRVDRVTVDGRVFLFSAALSIVVGLVCGLTPALGARRATLASLRSAAPIGEPDGQRWIRLPLVVGQISLAIVLLVGAGLTARTLLALHSLDLGFNPERVLTFGVRPRAGRGLDQMRAFSRDLIDRLQATQGVEAAGVGNVPLLGGLQVGFVVDGRALSSPTIVDLPSPGYFRSLQIRLHAGRWFDDRDDTKGQLVAIVNRAFARQNWSSDDVVGRQLGVDSTPPGPPITVVGVVDDVRMSSLEQEAPPVVYLPYLQPTMFQSTNYVVRTTGDPTAAVSLVRDVVHSLDPTLPLTRVATMDERVDRLVAPRRFNAWLVGVFSILALTLAAIGIYGLISEAVTKRTAEIGLRMALGAGRLQVLRLVTSRMAVVTAVGIVVGLGAAALSARWLSSMIFGVKPLDPLTLALVPIVVGVAAVCAAIAPARRATRVDPIIALRGD